jgi:hypothetical protein
MGFEMPDSVCGGDLKALGGTRRAGGGRGTWNGRLKATLIFSGSLMVGLLLLVVCDLPKAGQAHLNAPGARIILSEISWFGVID